MEVALADVGTQQGQCFSWAQRVIRDATGNEIGRDYRDGYLEAGGVEVRIGEAVTGDVIQIANDAHTDPDADYPGLHTAIILEPQGNGTFKVIDSNSRWDGIVRIRDGYSPAEAASRYPGLSFHIYRFDFAEQYRPRTNVAQPRPLPDGERARVNTPDDCLNLRVLPGLRQSIVRCLPDRTEVTLLSGTASANGYEWIEVATPWGNGWVAREFLAPMPTQATSSGATKPLFRYRTVLGSVAADN